MSRSVANVFTLSISYFLYNGCLLTGKQWWMKSTCFNSILFVLQGIASPTNPLCIVYDELYRLSATCHMTWCTHVGDSLTSIRLENVWEGQMIPASAFNIKQIKSHIKTELECQYTKKWLQEINDRQQNPILRTYAIFKENHCLKAYIQCLSLKKYQQAISCFQVSSHRLGIELGWHHKPSLPVEQRLCNFCNSLSLDNELHFLIKCEFHTNAIKTFYSDLDESISNFWKFLASPNEDSIFSLGKFIHDGFKSRELFQRKSLWNIF